jgi:alkylation response protein AidB-like acyl-CoA dehydrogenase
VRAVAYDGDGRDAGLWRSLAEAGWTGIAVPEANGGAGLRFEDVAIVLAEAGRAVQPLPLTTTLLASRAVARASGWVPGNELQRRIASGDASVTIALRDADRDEAGSAKGEADGWRFNGRFSFVPHGPLADRVLLEAGRGLIILPTDAPGLSWTDLKVIDRTVPQYELSVSDARVKDADSLYGNTDARDAIDALRDEWTVALAAESLGVAERMVELSVAYAKERVQFGRPIGANQAVKVRLADMGAAVERMRAAVFHAAVKIDADAEDRDLAVAMAKVATAGQGAWLGSQAIHVHGGVGYTWEHDLHLYFKRIKSNELLLGDESAHLARVADAVL